jgi:hypothetical protein
MQKQWLLSAVWLAIAVPSCSASEVRIVAVDEFGKESTGCEVTEFVELTIGDDGGLNRKLQDSHRNFVGLHGEGLAWGFYSGDVRCDQGYRGRSGTWIQGDPWLILVATSKQIGDNHFGGKPRLSLTIHPAPAGSWIKIVNPYSGGQDSAEIDPGSGTANLYNAFPGKYVVFLLKPGRIVCTYEIDHPVQGETLKLAGEGSCKP